MRQEAEEMRRTLPPRRAAGERSTAGEDAQQPKKVKREPGDMFCTRGAKIAAQQRMREAVEEEAVEEEAVEQEAVEEEAVAPPRLISRWSLEAEMEADGWVVESTPRARNASHIDRRYFPPDGGQSYNSLVAAAREHFPQYVVDRAKKPSEEAQAKTRLSAKTLPPPLGKDGAPRVEFLGERRKRSEEQVPAATPTPGAKKLKVVETKSKADRKTEELEAAEAAKARDADRLRILELERRLRGLERENAKLREDAERAPELEKRVRGLERENAKLREDAERASAPAPAPALAAAPTREVDRDHIALWEAALTRAETESRLFARLANLEAGWKPTPRPPAPNA